MRGALHIRLGKMPPFALKEQAEAAVSDGRKKHSHFVGDIGRREEYFAVYHGFDA